MVNQFRVNSTTWILFELMSEAGHPVQLRSATCEYRIFIFKTNFQPIRGNLIPLKKLRFKLRVSKFVTLIDLKKWFTLLSTLFRLEFVKNKLSRERMKKWLYWDCEFGIGETMPRTANTNWDHVFHKSEFVGKNSSLWITTPGLFWRFLG